MRFAAAHGLFEFKDGLIGLAAEPMEALVQESLHAFGDVILIEEVTREWCGGLMTSERFSTCSLIEYSRAIG